MYWMVGPDGRVYGPYSAEQLRQWLAEGRVTVNTQVQPQAGGAWRPLGAYPELAPAPAAPATPPTLEELRTRDYDLRIGACFERGLALLKAHAGLLIAGTLLVLVVAAVLRMPSEIGSLMVQLGEGHGRVHTVGYALWIVLGVAAALLTGPLSAGACWPYLRLLRGQPATVGDFFAGFRRGFWQLLLVQAFSLLLAAACYAPAGLYLVRHGFTLAHGLERLAPAAILVGLGLGALGFLAYLALAVGLAFALPLIVDRGLGAPAAIALSFRKVRQHGWRVLGLVLVVGAVVTAGVCACCVGLVFTAPLGLAVYASAYEAVFTQRHG